MTVTLSSRIEFKQLCETLEEISKIRAPKKKEEILRKFVDDCRNVGCAIKKEDEQADTCFFPILRLLLPSLERERAAFNLKEKTLGNLLINVFCLGKQSEDARKLTEYKIPTLGKNTSGDFAERVYWIFRTRLPNVDSSFNLEKINSFLDDISKTDLDQGRDFFRILLQQISAFELKWLIRIILKDLKLGIGHKKILEVYHPDAVELSNLNSDLRYLCNELKNPQVRTQLHHGIQIFSHFKPMLLEQLKIENVEKLFENNQTMIVQTKCDGERSQIHMKDGVFKYYTRQGYDISNNESYGQTETSGGFLTKNIAKLLDKNCRSVIFDGELMGWHKQRKKFGSKGMSFDVKKLTSTSNHQPCFIAFDIVMYNDDLMLDKPYSERWKLLNTILKEEEGVLVFCKTCQVHNSDELLRVFNQALDNDEEGIVVKNPDSKYKPNIRDGTGCYKIKAEYSENLIQDIDLIMLGGYYGEGKYEGLINAFLMGVIEPTNSDENPSKFMSVVSVGSGITLEKLKELETNLKEYWLKDIPAGVIGPLKGDKPNLWIEPKNSLIFQLRAAEIIRTDIYPLGYTLRFPRVVQIRTDKPWYGACTISEFKSLIKNPDFIQKLTKRRATRNDIEAITYSKSSRSSKSYLDKMSEKVVGIKAYNNQPQPISRLLDGKEICVINGDDEFSKENIEHVLLQHRAKIVQNPKKETFCVIAGNIMKAKAKNLIQSNNYDVVTLDWFKRITDEKNWSSLQDFLPWDLVSMRQSTRRRLSSIYDDCYDSFTTDADDESLRRSLEKAEEAIEDAEFSSDYLEEMDQELFESGSSPFSLFRNVVGYFPDSLDCTRLEFRFMAGLVEDSINDIVKYVFIGETDNYLTNATLSPQDLEKIQQYEIKIVNNRWIKDCFRNQEMLSDVDYIIENYVPKELWFS